MKLRQRTYSEEVGIGEARRSQIEEAARVRKLVHKTEDGIDKALENMSNLANLLKHSKDLGLSPEMSKAEKDAFMKRFNFNMKAMMDARKHVERVGMSIRSGRWV